MLGDLILALLEADGDPKTKEAVYQALEKVGVDRRSADVMANEFRDGGGN